MKNLQLNIDIFSATLFLFFIQQLTFLVESIYMLNLLNTEMDIRALGVSFLFLPGFLFALKHNKSTYQWLMLLMVICMSHSPMLSSSWRILSSGIGAGLFLTYLGLQLSDGSFPKVSWGQSVMLATLTSILLRAAGNTMDISITGSTKWISWVLIIVTVYLAFRFLMSYPYDISTDHDEKDDKTYSFFGARLSILSMAASFIFIYFAFASPAVVARWSETNNTVNHMVLVVSMGIFALYGWRGVMSLNNAKPLLIIWNMLFISVFIWNILLHRVSFPTLEHIDPVVVEETSVPEHIINYLMLILSPIIFINVGWFAHSMKPMKASKMAWPFLLAACLIIFCVFMLIFTNTWGYVGSLSRIFRNQFVLPFALAGIFLMLPYFFNPQSQLSTDLHSALNQRTKIIAVMLVVLCCGLILLKNRDNISSPGEKTDRLTLMTYNIQQGVDLYGNKNFEAQLRKIVEIDPDILCLQESDASRISGGNSDVVRFFTINLGYYSYYGPKTVAGTYGTAILSRFPLHNMKTIYTYSSKDEIGTAIADVMMGERKIRIMNSHPAGNEKSRNEHINMVIVEAQQADHVIAMGDYNFRQNSPYYENMVGELKDSWLYLYPDAIAPVATEKLDLSIEVRKTSSGRLLENGMIDMKGRIDHIFLSDDFDVEEAHYLPAPESETDHPLYWCVVSW